MQRMTGGKLHHLHNRRVSSPIPKTVRQNAELLPFTARCIWNFGLETAVYELSHCIPRSRWKEAGRICRVPQGNIVITGEPTTYATLGDRQDRYSGWRRGVDARVLGLRRPANCVCCATRIERSPRSLTCRLVFKGIHGLGCSVGSRPSRTVSIVRLHTVLA